MSGKNVLVELLECGTSDCNAQVEHISMPYPSALLPNTPCDEIHVYASLLFSLRDFRRFGTLRELVTVYLLFQDVQS